MHAKRGTNAYKETCLGPRKTWRDSERMSTTLSCMFLPSYRVIDGSVVFVCVCMMSVCVCVCVFC